MAVDAYIARGVTPIGEGLQQTLAQLYAMRQGDARLKLAQGAADIDAQNSQTFRTRTEQERQSAIAKAQEQQRAAVVARLGNAINVARRNPQALPYVQRFAQEAGLQVGEQITPEQLDSIAAQAGLQVEAPPSAVTAQRVGGATVLTQDGKVLSGGVKWPERTPVAGQTGPTNGGGKYGAPRIGINPESGKPEYFSADAAGNVKWLGASSATGVEAEARELGKDRANAKGDVGRIEANASDMMNVLNQLESSNLNLIYGAASLAPIIPGTAQADTFGLWEQVNGKAFLEAFNSLKGGGAITEKEGEKATDAITRLSQRKMSPGAAKKAIEELRSIVYSGVQRARNKAGATDGAPQAPTTFLDESEAEAAAASGALKPGTRITINGVSGVWR